MIDQIHDFGETERGGADDGSTPGTTLESSETSTKKLTSLIAIRERTKKYIDNFKYVMSKGDHKKLKSNIPRRDVCGVDFTEYLQSNSKLAVVYDKIMGATISKFLSGDFKYAVARELLDVLGIDMRAFEDLEGLFDTDEGYTDIPTFSCSDVKNMFYHYLVYSGFQSTGNIVSKLRITIDAHKTKFELSPILGNICDFVFSDNTIFSDVKLVRSIATEYDAATTSGAEVYVRDLEKKKSDRIKSMEKKYNYSKIYTGKHIKS